MAKNPPRCNKDRKAQPLSGAPQESADKNSSPGSEWLRPHAEGSVLAIRATPRASRTQFKWPEAGELALKMQLAAPPVDGEANAELLAALAKAVGVGKSQLRLLSGETGRDKRVLVLGRTHSEVLSALALAANRNLT